MHQPCPDCGTLMWSVGDLTRVEDRETLWHCPSCGQSWTSEQIELVYRLNEIATEKDEHSERDNP